MDDATQFIATLEKNRAEDVRIALTEYMGADLVDLRTWANFGDDGERKPTRKGVCLRVGQLPDLIRALEAARDTAERRGLLNG